MPAKKQQTHAKRARELAVREKRERKAAKKAEARAIRDGTVVVDENVGDGTSPAHEEDGTVVDENFGDGASPAHEEDETAATPVGQEIT